MKAKYPLTSLLTVILVASFGWYTGNVSAGPACDAAYVTKAGNVITVTPNGTNDTDNLQCAFDAAVAAGAGNEVRLSAGTFHTAQIVVNNFHGKFTGASLKQTNVINLPNLYVTPVNMIFNLPSDTNPWPNLFSFIDGDFAITDLAIHIVGDDLTTGWTIFGADPPYEEFACAIMIAGTNANVRIERLLLEGQRMENSAFGYNVINGIYYEGTIGEVPPPLSGSYSLTGSTIRSVPFASPVYNLTDASVVISGNNYRDTFIAADVGGLINTSYEFSHNRVADTVFGFDMWDAFGPYSGSTMLVRNNVFGAAMIGIAFEQTFGEGNQCLITGNNVTNVFDTGIFLGPGTTGCTVIGGNNKTNVFDLGTDNVLVGVNNMGTGVGPNIQDIRNIFK